MGQQLFKQLTLSVVGQSEVDGGVVEGVEEDMVGPVGAYKIYSYSKNV